MAFTYTPAAPDDTTRVRWYIRDTDSAAPIFDDDEITFLISEKGSYEKACIAAVQGLIAEISHDPDFKADWLQMDSKRALAGYERLLGELKKEFSGALGAGVSVNYFVTRNDL